MKICRRSAVNGRAKNGKILTMLQDINGVPVRDEPHMRVASIITREQIIAIQREMRTALLAYRNRHGNEPFAVFHIFGGVNTDWPHENLAVAALTRAYEERYRGDRARARRAASLAAGRIFKWVLWRDNLTYRIDHREIFRDGRARTFYRVVE